MKKLTSLFLAVVMCLLSMSAVFAADGVAEVTAVGGEIYYEDTKTIVVPVEINSNPGYAGLTIYVKFDPTALKVTKAQRTFETIDMEGFVINTERTGEVIISAASSLPVEFNGAIANITFEVLEGAYGTYPLTVYTELLSDIYQVDVPHVDIPGEIVVKKHAAVESVGMVDTTDVEGPNKSITSFMTTIDTYSESVNALTWNISYDGTTKSFAKQYDTTFTGTVKLGLYVENLYVADESALDVSVEF